MIEVSSLALVVCCSYHFHAVTGIKWDTIDYIEARARARVTLHS
jgi:hypothetical protein